MTRSSLMIVFELFCLFFGAVRCSVTWGFSPVESKLLRVNSPAQELSIDLNGAQDLYLFADYGGDSYDCDQAIWANPKLIDQDGNEIDLTSLTP